MAVCLAKLSREVEKRGQLIDRSIEVKVSSCGTTPFGIATAHIVVVILAHTFYRSTLGPGKRNRPGPLGEEIYWGL